MPNNMYLLTEWEGRTGKYLARGHRVRTERSEVRAPWPSPAVQGLIIIDYIVMVIIAVILIIIVIYSGILVSKMAAISDVGHLCFRQLTPVKTRYLLTRCWFSVGSQAEVNFTYPGHLNQIKAWYFAWPVTINNPGVPLLGLPKSIYPKLMSSE